MSSYCEIGEVKTLGINAAALTGIEAPAIQVQIDATSDLMDTYFDDRFTLPLTSFDKSVRQCCAVLTGAALLRIRGTDPDSAVALDIATRPWMSWLQKVSAGTVRPKVIDSSISPPATGALGTRVMTSLTRGLSIRGTARCRQPFQGD